MGAAAPRRPVLRWFVVAIGSVALLAGLFSLLQEPDERRIARDLARHGIETEARILSTRVTTSRLPSQIAARSDGTVHYSATIGLTFGTLEAETDIHLTADEYAAFEDGSLHRLVVIALPDDPGQVERSRGERMAAVPSDRLISFLLILLGAVPVIGAGFGPMLLRRLGVTF